MEKHRCFHCRTDSVVWENDCNPSDIGVPKDGVVHLLHCEECGASIEYLVCDDQEEEQMSKVKPCPFCGAEPAIYETEFGLTVRCKGDDHEAATFGDAAVDAWNNRWEYPCRNLSSEPHRFHCSECDTIVGHSVNYCPTCGSEVEE